MEIRKAEIKDIARLMPLVKMFHEEHLKPFGMGWDPVTIDQTMHIFIEQHVALVIENDQEIIGVIAGAVIPSFTDGSQRIFNESIWYVKPEHRGGSTGIRLLRLVEKYCINIGINKIVMIGMFNNEIDRLGSFYTSQGYTGLEIHYVKDLKNAKN